MMMNEIRNKIDEHLAWCIAAIRTQHVPANPWDRTGISAAMRDVQHARLLDKTQFRFLYPDAAHHDEKVGPLTKSLIAVRA